MKFSHILLIVCLCSLTIFSCKKDPQPPGISVTPSDLQITIALGEVIEFTIAGISGDEDLRTLEITAKPDGGVTTTVYEEELFGEQSTSTYVLDMTDNPVENQVLVFTITDDDGRTSQTARRVQLENDPLLTESSGHFLYSNFSTSNTNGFYITDLEPLFLSTLTDSLQVDFAQTDATDDGIQSNSVGSLNGIKFIRNNSFNYAEARHSTAADSYGSSVPLQIIADLQEDDILITRYDTLNMRHAAIKIIAIQDEDGTESDRIIFNVKK